GARRRRAAARPRLPLRRRLAPAGDPGRPRCRGLLASPAIRSAAGGRHHVSGAGGDDQRRHGAPGGPAGRHAAGPRVPGDRAPEHRRSPRRGPPPGHPGDEGLIVSAVLYLDVDDEITTAVTRMRATAESPVVLVVPWGSRLASSRINFRLLAREATVLGREL